MSDAPVMGRPSKYDPAYCDAIIDHMAEGWSAASFAASIRVSRATINVWAEAHPDFLEALGAAKVACAAWWEKQGRNVAETGGAPGQATMITFGLKNMGRDDWQDKVALVGGGPDDSPIKTETILGVDSSQFSAEFLQELAAKKVE